MTERPRRATAGVRKVFDPAPNPPTSSRAASRKTTVSNRNKNTSASSPSSKGRDSKSKSTSSSSSSRSRSEQKDNEDEKEEEEVEEGKQQEEKNVEQGEGEEDDDEQEEEASESEEEEEEQEPSSHDDTSDESWSDEEEEDEEDSDSEYEDDWSEEDERKYRRRSGGANKKKQSPAATSSSQVSAALQAAKKQRLGASATAAGAAAGAYMYPPIKRFAEILHSNYGFDFVLQSPQGLPTVDVCIGNFVNALEGSCETFGNANSSTWLNESPPPNITSGTVIIRPVSMRIPAMTGRWMVGHLISKLGCCGAMFWHTDLVGPDPQSATNLIREFAHSGMEIIEHNESEHLKNKGLRLIGRYSWDYYRQYGGGGYRIPQLASSLFAGPHCFFAPADEYKSRVYPEILMRVTEFDNGQNVRFQPFLNRINHSGALAVFPGQEYMFAKVFLQRDAQGMGWIGVRAMLLFTYNIGETWGDCQIEHVRIPA